MRTLTLTLTLTLATVLGACSPEVCGPEPEDPPDVNGYCEGDDGCAESDFCLLEWCDGPCRPMNRCFPRVPEGEWCNRDDMCADGLFCGPSEDFDSGECRTL